MKNSRVHLRKLKESSEDLTLENKINKIDAFIDSLYDMRQKSIKKDGEFALGNLIFKEMRNKGYLQNLKDIKTELENKDMSLEKLNESKNVRTHLKKSLNEKDIYRGESGDNNSKTFLPYGFVDAGIFFFADENDYSLEDNDSDYGELVKYELDDNAKLFKYSCSDTYCRKNDKLWTEKDENLNKILKNDEGITMDSTVSLQDLDDKDLLYGSNAGYAFTQYMAMKDLKSKGYDGVEWVNEDDLTPHQYQIWNKDVLKRVGKVSDIKESFNMLDGTHSVFTRPYKIKKEDGTTKYVRSKPRKIPRNELACKMVDKIEKLGYDCEIDISGDYDYHDATEDINKLDHFDIRVEGEGIEQFHCKVVNDGYLQFREVYIEDKYKGKGIAGKLIDAILSCIDSDWQVEVHVNMNSEFWTHIKNKYPDFIWTGV